MIDLAKLPPEVRQEVERMLAARGLRADEPTVEIRERIVLVKYDQTPQPGETRTPLETVIVEDGLVTVIPGGGEPQCR